MEPGLPQPTSYLCSVRCVRVWLWPSFVILGVRLFVLCLALLSAPLTDGGMSVCDESL